MKNWRAGNFIHIAERHFHEAIFASRTLSKVLISFYLVFQQHAECYQALQEEIRTLRQDLEVWQLHIYLLELHQYLLFSDAAAIDDGFSAF